MFIKFEEKNNIMIFEAKKDTFFSILFYSIMGFLLVVSIVVFKTIENNEDWCGFAILNLTLVLLIWIWYGTAYKIENNLLNITAGPFKKSIPIRLITKVEIGKTMWVGFRFGLSRGGVIIHFNKYDKVYITPEHIDEFCNALKRIHSEIEIAKNIG